MSTRLPYWLAVQEENDDWTEGLWLSEVSWLLPSTVTSNGEYQPTGPDSGALAGTGWTGRHTTVRVHDTLLQAEFLSKQDDIWSVWLSPTGPTDDVNDLSSTSINTKDVQVSS